MTTTIRFRVWAHRAGRVRDIAEYLDVQVTDMQDVMPALHKALGLWLVESVPGVSGQDLTLWQHQHDPAAGLFKITDGIHGGGTWTQVPDPETEITT